VTAVRAIRWGRGLAAIVRAALAGCGPMSVVPVGPASGPLPRPARVLVYDFAVSRQVAKQLGQVFVRQGWTASAD